MLTKKQILKQREEYEKTANYQLNSAMDNLYDIKFQAGECNFTLAVEALLEDSLDLLNQLKKNLQG